MKIHKYVVGGSETKGQRTSEKCRVMKKNDDQYVEWVRHINIIKCCPRWQKLTSNTNSKWSVEDYEDAHEGHDHASCNTNSTQFLLKFLFQWNRKGSSEGFEREPFEVPNQMGVLVFRCRTTLIQYIQSYIAGHRFDVFVNWISPNYILHMQIESPEFLHGRNDGCNVHEPEHVYPYMLTHAFTYLY